MNGKIYIYFNEAKFKKEGIKKYYVGQTTVSLQKRAGKDGKRYLNGDSKFARAIKKWGWSSFKGTIVEENIDTLDKLNELEIFYIKKFDSYNNGYNSTLGGEGQLGRVFSPESIKKMSESHKGKIPAIKGKKMSEESRKKMSEAKKGKPSVRKGTTHSEETKQLLSKKFLGKNNPSYGLKRSQETIEAMRRSSSNRFQAIHCNELNMDFESVYYAIKYIKENYNVEIKSKGNICSVCKGYRKHCGTIIVDNKKTKLTWRYCNENKGNND